MFGSSGPEKFALAVTIVLTSGERLEGNLLLSRAQDLTEALNRPDNFVEFAPRDGSVMSIAKHAIESMTSRDLPRTDQLSRRSPGAGFDPYRVLEIGTDASVAEVRTAYLAKARLYHPDQFANHPLPAEVGEYLQAMFIHVQAAYEELSTREKGKKRAVGAR